MIGLGFTSAIYLVEEEEGFIEVCLELRGSLERNVIVTLATSNGTALGMYCMCAKSFSCHLAAIREIIATKINDSYSSFSYYVCIITKKSLGAKKLCQIEACYLDFSVWNLVV